MTVKFSQFLDGVTPRTTDIVVGLRGYPNNPLNERFDFTGVNDTSGNKIITWSTKGALSVNYVDVENSLTTLGPTISAKGTDSIININIGGKGDSSYTQFLGTRAIAVPAGTTAEELGAVIGGLRYNLDTDFLRYWDIGANAWVDIIAGAAFDDATYVTNTNETANLPNSQPLSALATGIAFITTGTGLVSTLSIPLSMANGGTNANLTAVNGGVVYSTATAMAISAAGLAGQVLQSNGAAAPSWSTPTYPSASGSAGKILRSDGTNNVYSTSTFADTYTASNLLYSNGANTVTGLATANSASLVTTSAGVPIWSSTMTNGQVIIGLTGGTPVAASLTAGSGVSITPGAGTITIAATGSGGTVTDVTATLPLISSGGTTPAIAMQGLTGLAQGDLIYGDAAANTFARLTKDANATRYLSNQGTSNGPSWNQVNLANGVTGVLLGLNGGTGIANTGLTCTFGTNVVNPINQNGAQIYAADSVGTDSYAITLTPALAAYVDGFVVNFKAGTANNGPATLDINGLGPIAINKLNDQALITGDIEADQIITVVYNSSGTPRFSMISQVAQIPGAGVTSVATGVGLTGGPITTTGTVNLDIKNMVAGRLTLTTGVPVTTGDVTAATTIYYTPYKGTDLAVYSGSASIWTYLQTAQISIAVPATTATMYDVFVYNNAGTATLELTAWTNDTTRATALVYQDGVLCKTGALTRRYLGSFRTTGVSGQTEDSAVNRFVWNYYNRVRKSLYNSSTTSYTYQSATIRQAGGSATSQVNFVIGVSEDIIQIANSTSFNQADQAIYYTGFGLDTTTAFSQDYTYNQFAVAVGSIWESSSCNYAGFVAIGYHYLSLNEQSTAAALTTVTLTQPRAVAGSIWA